MSDVMFLIEKKGLYYGLHLWEKQNNVLCS